MTPKEPKEPKSMDTMFPKTEAFVPEKEERPVQIMTEKDSYISARIKAQPKSLDDLEVTTREEKLGIHRLSLPDFFEAYSYDCTRGISCEVHGWTKRKVSYGLNMEMDRWEQSKHGKYIFRWLNSNPKALDPNIDVSGWAIVNETLFPDCPRIHFSVSGGVRNGDSILGVMPVAKALAMRAKPSQSSIDRVKSESEKHENHPNFYKAKLDSERFDGDDFAPADAVQEGRDF